MVWMWARDAESSTDMPEPLQRLVKPVEVPFRHVDPVNVHRYQDLTRVCLELLRAQGIVLRIAIRIDCRRLLNPHRECERAPLIRFRVRIDLDQQRSI